MIDYDYSQSVVKALDVVPCGVAICCLVLHPCFGGRPEDLLTQAWKVTFYLSYTCQLYTHADSFIHSKSYKAGEIIIEETPLIVFSPKKADQITAVRNQFQNIKADKKVSHEGCIHDLDIPAAIDAKQRNEFRGMLLAASSYALLEDDAVKAKIQQLYSPNVGENDADSETETNEYEKNVILLAEEAVSFLKRQVKPSTPLHALIHKSPKECIAVMLIWSCNAFKGGYIYEITSRINHSCDFNAVVSTDPFSNDEKQTIRAVSDISAGDEISISYLGSFTYADFKARNERLISEKFFCCECTRCKRDRSVGDVASSVPCPKCHVRTGRYLEEDIQYDDGEVEVNYCVPCVKNGDKTTYSCSKCGDVDLQKSLSKAMDTAIERAVSHLEEGLAGQSEIDDDEGERDAKIEMTERLTCLATSVLGAKHWATNLLIFVMLSAKLSSLHAVMLCKSAGDDASKGDDDEADLMNDIAECIDSLERVSSYVKSLNLKSHGGHLVGNISVGVARVLVGFGDVKSMKYGATFATSVYEEYFKLGFEGQGMETVVETLINAWKRRTGDADCDDEQQKKRQKV